MKRRSIMRYISGVALVFGVAAPGFASTPTGEPWNPTSGVGRMTPSPTGDNNPSGVGRITPSPTGDNNPSGAGRALSSEGPAEEIASRPAA